jgi:hypothetical protein
VDISDHQTAFRQTKSRSDKGTLDINHKRARFHPGGLMLAGGSNAMGVTEMRELVRAGASQRDAGTPAHQAAPSSTKHRCAVG